jgi:hypothetical protein
VTNITVEVLGRHLGTAMASDEKNYNGFTVYAFSPAPGVDLPSPCDLVIDCNHGWVIPIRGEGGGEVVPSPASPIDLTRVLSGAPRASADPAAEASA